MNEMIQEAVLNSIDVIDEARLFAEYDVLMSMSAAYTKSALIQQESVGLDFDGFELVQEADAGAETTTKKSGRLSNMKKKLMNTRLVQWIIEALRWCRKQLRKLFKKKSVTAAEAQNIAANVESMTVDGSQYDAGELKSSRKTVDSGAVEGDVKLGNFDGVISIQKINISGFRMIADVDTLEKAVKAFVEVVDDFARYAMLSPAAGSNELMDTAAFGTACNNVDKLCAKALDIASKKTYGDANYGELYHKLYSIDDDLGKADERLSELIKDQNKRQRSSYYDDNNNTISATQYEKNLTDDDRANLTAKQKESLNRDIDRDFRTKAISASCRKLINLIGSTQACFERMKADEPKRFQQYLNEENEKLKKQIKAKDDAKKALTMPSI